MCPLLQIPGSCGLMRPSGKNGRCLSKHQSSAAHCPAAQI